MGVVTGQMLVDGHPRDHSFQRKTGYVQQQDLHLETSTVREALLFSAFLRQPADVSKEDKIKYVDNVIKMLEIEEYVNSECLIPSPPVLTDWFLGILMLLLEFLVKVRPLSIA